MALSDIVGMSLGAFLIFMALSLFAEVASPYAASLYALFATGILALLDSQLEGILDNFVQFYHNHCGSIARKLAQAGVPARVLIKQLAVPVALAHVLAHLAANACNGHQTRLRTPAMRTGEVVSYAVVSVACVGICSARQAVWAPPQTLSAKPLTLSLLLVPVVLGYIVLDTFDWQSVVLWRRSSAYSKFDARTASYPTAMVHVDPLFLAAALGYHVYLATRRGGSSADGAFTVRSLESGYGAAKLILVYQCYKHIKALV